MKILRKIKEYFHNRKLKWEAICKRCGQCCYGRKRKKGRVIINYNDPCEYLDTSTNLCRVYHNRFKVCSYCRKVTIFHAYFSLYLPENCGYVEYFRKRKKA